MVARRRDLQSIKIMESTPENESTGVRSSWPPSSYFISAVLSVYCGLNFLLYDLAEVSGIPDQWRVNREAGAHISHGRDMEKICDEDDAQCWIITPLIYLRGEIVTNKKIVNYRQHTVEIGREKATYLNC